MRKNIFKIFLCEVIFLLVYNFLFSYSQPSKMEAVMHYNMAMKNYKEKKFNEVARLLEEVVGYYDTEDLKSYELLIKVYKKLGEKEKLEDLVNTYKNIKKIAKLRKENKLNSLSPVDILSFGTPKQKIEICEYFLKEKDIKNIPYLINAFTDTFYNHYLGIYEVREKIANLLVEYKEDDVVPFLVKSLNSENKIIRWWCLETLSRIYNEEPKQKEILDVFIKALEDRYEKVGIVAIKTLTKWNCVQLVKEKILQMISSDNFSSELKYYFIMAIGKGEVYEAKDELLRFLETKNKLLINQTIISLTELGKKNKKFAEEIKDTFFSIAQDITKPVSTRFYAIRGLGNILKEQYDKDALRKLVYDENIWIRSAAASALGEEYSEEIMKIKEEAFKNIATQFSIDSKGSYEEARMAGLNRALKYLESIQKEDGSFPSFFPLGTTELAALCFLNQGYREDYPLVKKAIEFILKWRQKDGSFFCPLDEGGKQKPLYQTSLAVLVLIATENPEYKPLIEDAVNWIKNVQNPDGGFGYYKDSRSDVTCTRFALWALDESYKYLKIRKNDEVWVKVVEYLKEMQNSDGGFGYSKDFARFSYGSMTADGLICLLLANADKKNVEKTLDWISENYTWEDVPFDPQAKKHYEYFVWAQANALHLAKKDVIKDNQGKEHIWYDELFKKLLKEQDKEGFWRTKEEPLFTAYFIKILQLKKLKYLASEL